MTISETTACVSRMLILRGGALGDFVLTLPAIRALRRHWPLAAIELIGHPGFAELALVAGLIDRVRPLDSAGMAQWFVPRRVWPENERAGIASFDLILSYLNDPAGVLAANLRSAGARRVIACPPIVTHGHAADHFLRPAREFGENLDVSRPLLPWPEALRKQGRNQLRKLGLTGEVIGLHPGSGSSRKNWPIEKFVALADNARGRASLQPLFILGEADADAARELPRLAPNVPVLANRSLTEAASVLAACRGYAGNDSGITHLAAALGIPVVALFGPTDPAVWGPRGANAAIFKSRAPTTESLAAIEPDAVFEALMRLIADFRLKNQQN